ncbi:hypothetical protein WDU94_006592 [Cyamophila willieti]
MSLRKNLIINLALQGKVLHTVHAMNTYEWSDASDEKSEEEINQSNRNNVVKENPKAGVLRLNADAGEWIGPDIVDACMAHGYCMNIDTVNANAGEEIDTVNVNTGKEIETVTVNGGQEIDTVNVIAKKEIETVTVNGGEEIDTVNVNPGEEIDTVNVNAGKEIETVNVNPGEEIDFKRHHKYKEKADKNSEKKNNQKPGYYCKL